MRNLLILLSVVLFFSCKPAKQIIVEKEVVRVDTIRDYKVVTKFNAVHDTLTIDNPCDSSGVLTSFYSRIKLPQGNVVVRSVRGKIQATVNVDSIESVYRDKYNSSLKSTSQKSEKVIHTTSIPKWAIWFMAISGVLSFLYIREKVSIFVK